ncbi:diacylglycerol kinase catalytic domain-containing protein [Ditylenchus destructor]|nr:diacylglycerol kinase catalytic domain-containing protein [Ditylenchus destructor]
MNGTANRIYEGFIAEVDPVDKFSKGADCCLSWNTKHNFLHVTAVPKPFRIYLDEIVTAKQVGPDNKMTLTTYVLNAGERQVKLFEITVKDFSNFKQEFCQRIQPAAPPHKPRNATPKVIVIINPFSGQQKALDYWLEHAQPIFKQANILYETGTTASRGHATKIAHEINLDDVQAIAIASGDGLVAEVILGLLTRKDKQRALKVPILHIPGGTGNGLAASVAYQSNEPFPPRGVFCKQMALMMTKPRYRPLRLYHTEMTNGGKIVHQPMFMSVTWGLIADIDLGSERFRWAGMIRYHIEAFIRIARLPTVSRYKGRISYLPVTDKALLRKTMLKANADRELFGNKHFECTDVKELTPEEVESSQETGTKTVEEAFKGTHILNEKVPNLTDPVPRNWEVIDSEFVFVSLTSMSHIGSDLPYTPSARLEEEVFYLSFVDWRTLKTRFHMAHLLITIDRCAHLAHACLQTIPVLACRVEPAAGTGGYVALDGEACESGASFQVVSTSLQATVVARQARENAQEISK